MPTFNKVDLLDCAAGRHDFSDDATECRVCGHAEESGAWSTTADAARRIRIVAAEYRRRKSWTINGKAVSDDLEAIAKRIEGIPA